jgi:hypothetical protein
MRKSRGSAMILPVLDAFAESFARVVVPMLRDGLAR